MKVLSSFCSLCEPVWTYLQRSIRRQMMFGFGAAALMIMVATGYILHSEQRNALYREGIRHAATLANALARSSSSWVLENDLAGLQEIIAGLSGTADFKRAFVLAPNGEVLASTHPEDIGMFASDAISRNLLKAVPEMHVLLDQQNLVDIAMPVMAGSRHIGWVRVELTRESANSDLRRLDQIWLSFVLFAVLLVSFVSLLLSKTLTKGLNQLMDVTESVTRGDREVRANIGRNDEVGVLANNFNSMLDTLHESDLRFRQLAENINEVFWMTESGKHKMLYVSPAYEFIWGRSVQLLIDSPQTWLDCIHPDDRQRITEALAKQIEGLYDEEYRIIRPDGEIRWIHDRAFPIQDSKGHVYRIAGIAEDVTESKNAAEALRASRDLLGSIIENVPIRVFWKDTELRYLGCNSLFARDAGMSRPEEVVGKDDFQMGWREQAELYRADDRRVIETNTPKLNFEEPQSTPDGHTIWLRTSKVPLHDADGKLIGLLGIYDDVTERIRAQQALRESHALLEATERLAGIGGFRWEREGEAMFWSEENFRIFGRDPKDGAPNRAEFIALAHPDDRQRLRDAIDASIGAGKPYNVEFRIIRPDGSVRYIHAQDDMKFDKDGKVVSGAGMHHDITERKLAEAKIVYLNRVYAMLSGINTLIVRVRDRDELFREACRVAVDAGKFRMSLIAIVDRNAMNIVPVASAGKDEELLTTIQGLLSLSEDAPKTMVALVIRDKKAVISNDSQSDPRVLLGKKYAESGVRSLAIFPLIVADEAVGAIALYATEIDFFHEEELKLLTELADDIAFAIDHIEKQERIDYLAYYDVLTGLPNRALFSDRVKYALSMAERNHANLAILFLDVDRLKYINDSIGHNIGDKLLIEVAKRLKLALRDEDTVSRQSGDEFVVVLPSTTADGAAHVAEKLLATVALACRIEQYELSITCSIGIAIYPGDGEDFDSLYKCADIAMYRAKHDGGNNYKFFTAEMQTHSARTLQLENALRHALEHDQFRLHYQPQVSLQDGRVIGAEALLRWQHPELGNVSPAEFIPIAESSGQILQIGEWIVRTAARQMKSWIDSGMAPMIIAVNLSAVQFRHPNLPEMVTQILDSVLLPAQYLELELTEGVAMHDPLGAIAMMDNLHERGIRMSIDDFGTGYSSLSYLKRFKVYKLKIDQSFVRDITDDPNDKAIVSAIISLANSLGLQTIAEGVETEGQLAFLREQGCNEVQGYYFSKPLPAEQFETFVRGTSR